MFIKRVDLNPTEVDTLKHLVRENIDVEIAAYGNSPEREEQNRRIFESEGIRFTHVTDFDLSLQNKLAARIIPYILRTRPEVVVSTEVYHRHSLILSLVRPRVYSYTFQNIIKRSRSIPIMGRFCKIITPVPSTARVWAGNGFPHKRIYVVPFGVDTNRFHGTVKDFNKVRVLFVGRITEEKGLTYLIEGLSQLKIPFEAMIVGGGQTERFSTMALELGLRHKLRFVPFVERERLHEFYGWSNIFVMPSIVMGGWAEQLGMALLEAMAYGRVVIGTNTGAIPDVMRNSGIIVGERSSSQISKAIEWVVENPEKASILARKARDRVVDIFDARLCAKMMYQTLMGRVESYQETARLHKWYDRVDPR